MKQYHLLVIFCVGIFNVSYGMLPAVGAAAAAAAPYVASAGSAIITSEVIRKIKERNIDPQSGPITLRHYEESGRQMAAVGQILAQQSDDIRLLIQEADKSENFRRDVLTILSQLSKDQDVSTASHDMLERQQFMKILNADENEIFCFEDSIRKYKQDEILSLSHRASELYQSHNDPQNKERAKIVDHLCIMASRLLHNNDIQQADQLLATSQTLLALVEHSAVVAPGQGVFSETQSFSSGSSSGNRRPTYADIVRGEGPSSYFEAMGQAVDYNLLVSEDSQLQRLSEQYGANEVLQVLDDLNVSENFTIQELAQVSSRLKKLHAAEKAEKEAQLRRRKGKGRAR